MRATWYVLEDGNVADPNECAPDDSGKLVHQSGIAVAMRGHVPSSRGVDLDPDGNAGSKEAPAVDKPARNREMKAAGAKKYQTR